MTSGNIPSSSLFRCLDEKTENIWDTQNHNQLEYLLISYHIPYWFWIVWHLFGVEILKLCRTHKLDDLIKKSHLLFGIFDPLKRDAASGGGGIWQIKVFWLDKQKSVAKSACRSKSKSWIGGKWNLEAHPFHDKTLGSPRPSVVSSPEHLGPQCTPNSLNSLHPLRVTLIPR